ncbi:MAG: RagB/SusD family nutrient uptake outer membrane protein [Bacteroidota bacterium]
MKIINNIILTLFSLFILSGCDDEEFLKENPKTFYTTDNIFNSGAQVEQTLITLYNADRTFRTADNQFNGIIQGKGSDVMVTPAFRQGNNFSDYSTINPDNGQIADLFNRHYQIIGYANATIAAAELEGVTFDSEEQKAYILAQARFFRAKMYGSMAQLFGGVAIVTEVASEPRFDYERASRAAVYQFAIDELEAIVNDLPETTDQPGRVVRGAAQHFLSEFYLSLGIETGNSAAYDQAIAWASEIIDGGIYSLMTTRFGQRATEPGKDVYWDLFQLGNINYADGNNESIWTYQNDFGAVLNGDGRALLEHPRYWMPVYRAIEGFDGVAEDAGGRGVAFFAPTPLTETIIWDPSISDGDIRGSETNIRRTIYYNDPTYPPEDPGSLMGQEIPQSAIDAANASLAGSIYPIFEKFTTDMFEGLDQGQNRSNIFRDRYAIRLPETILLRAEAYHRKGDNDLAADDINLIRSRSQCNILAAPGDVDIDYILDERARELFGEESRWNTLLRMGGTVAVDRIRTYAKHQWTINSLTFDYNLLPIPQGVIDRNKDVVWEQNPGWNR